jgi:hypothetical protein
MAQRADDEYDQNGCTRSSSARSKRRPCCHQRRLPPAGSTAGRRLPRRRSISQLTSPLESEGGGILPGEGGAGTGGVRGKTESGVSTSRGGRSGASRRSGKAGNRRAQRGNKGRTGGEGSGLSEEPASASRIEPNVPAANFRITDELELGKGSEGPKFRDNIAAIEALKNIELDARRATPDEQRALARYVGWGGLANAFRSPETNEFKPDWSDRGDQLAPAGELAARAKGAGGQSGARRLCPRAPDRRAGGLGGRPPDMREEQISQIDAQIREISQWPDNPGVARDPARQSELDELGRQWEV